jgi:hypothetical protein
VFGKALQDNGEQGLVHFVDPSFVDEFWKDAHTVQEYFATFGVTNIRHHLMTTQQFIETEVYRELRSIGIVFIDGHHSEEQARFDPSVTSPLMPSVGRGHFSRCRSLADYDAKFGEGVITDTLSELASRPDVRLLEIGCGEGRVLMELRRSFPNLDRSGINRNPWPAMRCSQSLVETAGQVSLERRRIRVRLEATRMRKSCQAPGSDLRQTEPLRGLVVSHR